MTAKAIEFNQWCIVLGQDFRQNLVIRDPILPKIPNPNFNSECPEDPITNPKEIFDVKDLTDYDAKMTIRDGEGLSATELITLETPPGGTGITIGSPAETDGTIEILIDNLVTEATPFPENVGEVFYDLWLFPPAPADNQRILFGTIEIVDPITDV